MALNYDSKGKLFQADYQAPFGSLDTSAYPSAINPANFAAMDGAYIENNILKSVNYKAFTNALTLADENFITFIPYQQYYSGGSTTNFLIGYKSNKILVS